MSIQKNDDKPQGKKRISQKQRQVLVRQQKRKDFAADYQGLAQYKAEDESWQKNNPENLYVERKMRAFEEELSNQLKVPRGIYQEAKWIEREHKREFLEAIKTISPHIIEELRSVVQVFKALFGEVSCSLNEKGQSEQMGDCLKKISQIEDLIYKAVTNQFSISLLPDKVRNFNYPGWKRVKLPLRLAKYTFDFSKNSQLPVPTDREFWIWFSSKMAVSDETKRFEELFSNIAENIIDVFKPNDSEAGSVITNYLSLQVFLFDWMEKYHLEKYWLLGVAYSILCQFSENESLPIEDVQVFLIQAYRELQAENFKFEMPGWWAGKISAKEYEKQVLKEVKKYLPKYFHNAYCDLDLSNKTQVTKSKDPTYKSIYFLLAWNEGATNPQIAEHFAEFYKRMPFGDDIKDATNSLLKFNLPKRVDKPGRKSKPKISSQRLELIKQSLIKKLEKRIQTFPQNNIVLIRELNSIKNRAK